MWSKSKFQRIRSFCLYVSKWYLANLVLYVSLLLHELLWLPLLSLSSMSIADEWLLCDANAQLEAGDDELFAEIGEKSGDRSGEMGGESLSSWSDDDVEPPPDEDDDPDDDDDDDDDKCRAVDIEASEALSECFLL